MQARGNLRTKESILNAINNRNLTNDLTNLGNLTSHLTQHLTTHLHHPLLTASYDHNHRPRTHLGK